MFLPGGTSKSEASASFWRKPLTPKTLQAYPGALCWPSLQPGLELLGPVCCFQGLQKKMSIPAPSLIPTFLSARPLCYTGSSFQTEGMKILVPEEENFRGFFSNLFTVSKPNDGICHILDLKPLEISACTKNFHAVCKICYFFLQSRGISRIIGHPRCLSSFSYFPPTNTFYALMQESNTFNLSPTLSGSLQHQEPSQCTCTTPDSWGICVLGYLNDLLLKDCLAMVLSSNIQRNVQLLQPLGCMIIFKESTLMPSL